MSTLVLVINAGSSSLKYQLLDPATGQKHAKGLIERIGEAGSDVPTHSDALSRAIEQMGDVLAPDRLLGIGHRVVHGGSRFAAATIIDEEVREAIEAVSELAPLHNPANLQGIEATTALFPDVPQVAIFDTAFHQSLPPAAYTYAVPREWREAYQVRRYGFHGTSHSYVSRRAADLLGTPLGETALVVLHLGNGCSATAVLGGESVETSMGLTPLEGLVMGTRSGDVDPSLGAYLGRVAGMDLETVDRALNKESGLLGLTGVNDFRSLETRAASGDEDALLAIEVVLHRLVKYIGAYAAVLGRLDAVVLTGGIGENGADLREGLAHALGLFGVVLDEESNARGTGERFITTRESRTALLVVPTNEELEIAVQAAEVIGRARG